MEAKTMLNSIKDILGMEIKLEQMTLENGTIFEAESFEVGKEVFIITDDEKVAVPVGEYQLEDGKILVVIEEGVIAEIKDGEETPEETPEEEVEEVEAKEEEKEEMQYATKEELAEVKEIIEEIKAMLEPKEEEQLSKQVEEVELSKPATEPLTHNPEANTTKKVEFKFAQNRKQTTFDKVLNKIINK
jgi:hypothetical protein